VKMGRFRIKWGAIEIEYEGEDSESRYSDALEWLKMQKPLKERTSGTTFSTEEATEEERVSKRGGARSPIIGPKIDELVTEGWFKKHRKVAETVSELRNRAVPGVTEENVVVASKRRVGQKKLKAIKDKETGEWIFWQE